MEEVPRDWKKANVTSVPKKEHSRSYRPVIWKAKGASLPGSHFQTHEVYQNVWN